MISVVRACIRTMPTGIERYDRNMTQRGIRPITAMNRRRLLHRVEAFIGKPMLEATMEDLARWRDGLTVCPASAAGYIATVRSFCKWAHLEGLIDVDPSVRLVSPRLPNRLPHPIPESDLSRALLLAPDRIRPWLILAAFAGLRAQEIAYLTGSDVVLDGHMPHILVSEQGGKGGKQRIVPIGQTVISELRHHGVPARGWVFTRHDGQSGPNRPHLVSLLATTYLRELGIDHTLHSLRHRYGTALYEASLDLRMVGEVMGHSDPATTAKYVQYNQHAALKAARALDVAS